MDQLNLNNENNSDNTNNGQQQNQQQSEHQKLMADTLQGGDVNARRIFAYKEKAPAAPDFHQNPLRVVYSVKTPMSTKSGSRYIPRSPERILDAPDIINDYCMNSCFFLNLFCPLYLVFCLS